jgi:hypothetical protein
MPISIPDGRILPSNPKAGGGFRSLGVAAGAAFTPFRLISFDGLSNGQAVVGAGSVAGKKFDSVQGNSAFANGFGTIATTSEAMPGATSCCAMSIAQGSDGDPSGGDTGAGFGAFGGKFIFPVADRPAEGEELWTGMWMKFPSNWSWGSSGTNIGFLKFLRFENDDPGVSGKIDIHALNGAFDGSAAGSAQIGWTLTSEFDPKSQSETHRKTQDIFGLGVWRWVELYQKFSFNRALTEQVIWLDEQFVYSIKGTAAQWRAPNGTIQTATIGSGIRNLPTATAKTSSFMLLTYWNGYAPQDQTCYVQNVALHPSTAGYLPTKTDALGNTMMGEI